MSSPGSGDVLRLQHLQRVDDPCARLRRLDDVINVASLRGLEGVGECALVVGGLLLHVLAAEDDLHCALRAHDSDLSRGPGIVEITVQVLAGHDIVCATVGLASDESDLRHCRLSIGVQELGAVLDDSAGLLLSSWEEPWHVSEGDEGDLEGVAESDETRRLDAGVDVEAAGEDRRLVGNDSTDATFDLSEASDHVSGVAGHDLVEVVPVGDTFDDGKHVIWLVRIVRHHVVEKLSGGLVLAIEGSPGLVSALVPAVLGQVAEKLPRARDSLNVVLEDLVGDAADFAVHLGATELLLGNFLIGDGLDDLWASHEHVARVLDHEDEVCEGG